MIITITGLPGSGKTTVIKQLSQTLGIPWYSVGNLRGKMAEARGISIDELNALGETESFTDKEVDDYQTALGASGESFVIDGRLSWYFIPHSFKVFLEVDPDVGARRIYQASKNGERTDEHAYQSEEDVKRATENRIASDARRYQKYYGIDLEDRRHYDLVLDTTHLTVDEKAQKILDSLKTWLEQKT